MSELKYWIRENCFTKNGRAHPFINKDSWWQKTDFSKKLEIEEKTKFLKDVSIVQRIWHVLNDSYELSKCKDCGKVTTFVTLVEGYRDFCSIKCQVNFNKENIKTNRRNTFIEKYGSLNVSFDRKVKEIVEVSDVDLVNWIKESCFTVRGGLNSRTSMEEWWKDKQQPLKMIYENTSYLGLENKTSTLPRRLWHLVNQTTEIPTCKECGSTVNFDSFKNGYREYCSIFCVTQSDERNKKIVSHPNHKIGIENSKKTCLEKYGVEYTYQSPEFQKCLTERKMEKYGTLYVGMEKVFESNLQKYGVKHLFELPEFQEKLKNAKIEKYGTSVPPNVVNSESKAEISVKDFLNSLGFKFVKNHTVLQTLELDGYCEEKNLAFEYCGLYWHSEEYKKPAYHRFKYEKCVEQGIRLFTIFEDEWIHKNELVKNYLKSLLGLYEKEISLSCCDVKEILDRNLADDFLNEFCLQEQSNSAKRHFGLYHNNDLIGCVAFGRNYSNPNDIILNRIILKPTIHLQNGFEYLVKQSLEMMNIQKAVTWSDNRWPNDLLYETNGFKKEFDQKIDYTYADSTNVVRIPKSEIEKSLKLGKDYFDEVGYYRIYDCGKKRWAFEL